MRVIPTLTLTLLAGTLSAPALAATTCSAADMQKVLQGPRLTSYRNVTKDMKLGGQVIKGATTVSTMTMKAIPNGYQMTTTDGKKTNVMQTTCVNGKLTTTVNGKALPTDLNVSGIQVKNGPAAEATDLKLSTRKVGDVWGGQLSSTTSEDMTSESSVKYKLLAQEKLTTPAGTFDTYKVEMQTTVKMTMKNAPKELKLPGLDKPITTTTTMWVDKKNPDLMVKMTTDNTEVTLLKYQK